MPILFFNFVVAAVVLHFQPHCLARLILSPESFLSLCFEEENWISFVHWGEFVHNTRSTDFCSKDHSGNIFRSILFLLISLESNIAEHHRVRLWEYYLQNRGSEKVKWEVTWATGYLLFMQSMHSFSGAGYTNYLLLLQQHTHRLPSITTVLGAVQAEVKKN